MKQFFKMTLATICGIAIFLVVTGFFLTVSLLGMVASDSASTKVQENSVFVIKLDGTINERAEKDSPVNQILNMGDMSEMGLDDLICAIRKAKDNEDIKGIYLEGGMDCGLCRQLFPNLLLCGLSSRQYLSERSWYHRL